MADASDSQVSKVVNLVKELPQFSIRFKLAITATMVAAWYGAFFLPTTNRIDTAKSVLAEERKRTALGRDIESMRAEIKRAGERLPSTTDRHAWVEWILEGVRKQPVKVLKLDPKPNVEVGPYQAAVAVLHVSGSYTEVDEFLQWLEGLPRLVRVTQITVNPKDVQGAPGTKNKTVIEAQVTIMGILG